MRQPRLSDSQNFLRSDSLVRDLVDQSSLTSEDLVVEIGPGDGIITRTLAKRAKAVMAVEADFGLYTRLTQIAAEFSNLTVYHADFRQWPLPVVPYKVFSNIPFNITAEVLRKLFDSETPPDDSYLIAQKEAAFKYAGSPWGHETLVSVLHKPWFAFDVRHHFRATDFSPSPRVSIVLLRVQRLNPPLLAPGERPAYTDFVTHGFTSLRPSVKKAFKNIIGHVQFLRLATELGFSPTAAPSDLTFEQWLGMFRYFMAAVEPSRRGAIRGAHERLNRQQQGLQKVHRTRSAPDWRRSVTRG